MYSSVRDFRSESVGISNKGTDGTEFEATEVVVVGSDLRCTNVF